MLKAMAKETQPKFFDETLTETQTGTSEVELIIDEGNVGGSSRPYSSHPYSIIPPLFDSRRSAMKDSRRVLTVETWDGRSVMSLETEG